VSEVLGKARVTITNTLRLLNLPQEVQEEMRKGRISFAHGRALLELSDANQQRRLAQQIISNRLSVNELENLIKKHKPRTAMPKNKHTAAEPFVAVLEEELQQILATKVRIFKSKSGGILPLIFIPTKIWNGSSSVCGEAKTNGRSSPDTH
jgi:ParB family chromosome partitioning protein